MSPITWIFIYLALRCPGNIFSSGTCVDQHHYCSYWASIGECSRNYLYMLHKCPVSCKVCSGAVDCRNVYNDQYCTAHSVNCWRQGWAQILYTNCRKTCVCGCCPTPTMVTATTAPTTITTATTTTTASTTETTTVTTVRFTKTSTARQTTTEGTGEEGTTMSEISSQTPSASKVNTSSLPTTGKNSTVRRQGPAEKVQRSGFNILLLVAVIVGVVVLLGVLGLSLFCFWRKKRPANLNKPGKSLPATGTSQIPVIESTPDSPEAPLYQVLEGPKDQATSDPDYEDPTDQGTRTMIRSSVKTRENELYEPAFDHSADYCYSYSVANENLSLRVNKNSLREQPQGQSHIYQVLENPNAGYQAPEKVKGGDQSYEAMREIDPASYLPLNKTGQSFYQPLKKKKGAPPKVIERQ